ncbi:MAG TPA: amidohydrolase family protein [Armatimonadota bacterium]|nr:amidohydrolase family protein [Armatimonadota bacterium]
MSTDRESFTYYDSHLHLPSPDRDGIAALRRKVESEAGMWGGNLIVLTRDEAACVSANLAEVPSELTIVPYLAAEGELPPELTRSGWYKVHPTFMQIAPEAIAGVVGRARSMGTGLQGLIVHCFPWGPELRFNTGVELVVALAQALPEAPIVATHAGGCDAWRLYAHTIELDNVLYDFSITMHIYRGTDCVKPLQAYLRQTPDRVLFGSDWPSAEPAPQLADYAALAEGIGMSQAHLADILNRNARRLWGHGDGG